MGDGLISIKDDIPVGERFPRKSGIAPRLLSKWILALTGWRVSGSIPNISKVVLIGGPHTSNWDFVFGVLAMFRLGLDVHWMGKHSLFRWPFGVVLRHFGGIPVNRSSPGALYRDILNGFKDNQAYVVGLSPEGTRSHVTKWKPGFHRIATSANVPILPAAIDFGKKEVHFGPLYEPTSDFKKDVAALQAYYSQFEGKRPELFGRLEDLN